MFLFRRELNVYWDLRVLVHVDGPTSLSRAIERDTGAIGSADVVRRKYKCRYEPAWLMYCEIDAAIQAAPSPVVLVAHMPYNKRSEVET